MALLGTTGALFPFSQILQQKFEAFLTTLQASEERVRRIQQLGRTLAAERHPQSDTANRRCAEVARLWEECKECAAARQDVSMGQGMQLRLVRRASYCSAHALEVGRGCNEWHHKSPSVMLSDVANLVIGRRCSERSTKECSVAVVMASQLLATETSVSSWRETCGKTSARSTTAVVTLLGSQQEAE